MSQWLFEDNNKSSQCGQRCAQPVPDIWERVERNCCEVKKRCCPPKTKARDVIRISREESVRCFHYGKRTCDGTFTQPVINRYYKMVIREKGYCDELLCLAPYKATHDGAICWKWPDAFLNLPDGYYEADVYIDGCECVTHLFYLPKCRVQTAPAEVKYRDECSSCHSCGSSSPVGCGCHIDDCCSAIPMVDEVIIEAEAVGCPEECGTC